MEFNFIDITDIGNYRKQNQDSLEFVVNKKREAFGIVCDGMGGHARGDIASKIAVQSFIKIFKKTDFSRMDKKEINRWLRSGVGDILNDMIDYSNASPDTLDMGTTLTAILFVNDSAFVVNVGDSRTYKVLESQLYQITEDQNLMNSTTEDEKQDIRMSNLYNNTNEVTFWKVLTSALGPKKTLKIDTYLIDDPKGMFMLTTDGVHDYIDNNVALMTLKNPNMKLRDKAKILIDDAKENGSTDNLSVLLIEVK